ncbi:MAG: HAD-IIB family hydrolase [Firmicutes bacterium]|nr:HAD-IIB family hydrolase [Bacillota bacterium]
MPVYRLLALDLDGTLLDAQGRVPPAHRDAVRQAMARGLEVVIATGRSWHEMVEIYHDLGLTTPAITLTGCQVVDARGRVLWEQRMDPAAAERLAAWAEAGGYCLVAVLDSGDAVATCRAPDFGPWEQWNPFTRVVGPLRPLLRRPPLLMAVYGRSACAAAAPLVRELPHTQTAFWAPTPEEHVLCLWHREADKGRALAAFCQRRGYRPAEVIAMGDSVIDIPMLAWAGAGVAMPGAPPEVQAAAALRLEGPDPWPVRTALRRLGVLPEEADGGVGGPAGVGS